jgi:hypothetical protein
VTTSTVYEVRCERCRTSFAPETKRCVHCGGPLGRGIGALLRPGAAPDARGEANPEAEAEEELVQVPGRNLLWVVTAVLALAVSLLRSCMER